jgi:hypothetical protein
MLHARELADRIDLTNGENLHFKCGWSFRYPQVLAGIDFFTVEVLTWRGLVTYYVLFFIHLESRRVSLAGITRHPDEPWMQQMARNATDEGWGYLDQRHYVLHDRDTKFCASFGRFWLLAGSRQ